MSARKRAILLLAAACALLLVLCGILAARARAVKTAAAGVPRPTTASSPTETPGGAPMENAPFGGPAVLYGDSLTGGGRWSEWFPGRDVLNLGVSGDTVADMIERVSSIREAGADQVFILGGINSLMNQSPEAVLEQYGTLLERVGEENPDARLYVLSVLPIGRAWEGGGCDNGTIEDFNAGLEELAREHGAGYIDIFSAYEKDGCLDEAATYDGIHLTEEGYAPYALT